MTECYVALLRGVNVGGKNKVSMPQLCVFFEEAGATHVQSFINSGNIVFKAEPDKVELIRQSVEGELTELLSKPIPVIVRSNAELAKAMENNPYPPEGDLFIVFLAKEPTQAQSQTLDPNRSPGDEYTLIGKTLYLNLTRGAAHTKLTNAYFDSKLKTISTSRNWRTTQNLHQMLIRLENGVK